MWVSNTGNKKVLLEAGEWLLPGSSINCTKKFGELLLKNPNITKKKKAK